MNEIIYLDSAATMQKPQSVIDAQVDFLQHNYANSGRGICPRSAAVDNMVLHARMHVADFIDADVHQVIFTSGATDALNRVVALIGVGHLRVVVSNADHNSARLPWAMRDDTELVVLPINGYDNTDNIPVADVYVINAMSNVLGMAVDVAKIVREIRLKNKDAKIVVDASQYVVHNKIDAVKWDADFICFSGHKIGADTGIGIMYIKEPARYRPDKFGGGMVARITDDKIYFNDAPELFEAGTLPLTQIAGFTSAIDSLVQKRPNMDLIKYAYDELLQIKRIGILTHRDATLLSFVIDDMHVLDFGAMIGAHGVCVRVGNMCAPWTMQELKIDGCVRISVGSDNTIDEMRTAIALIKDMVK